jgi:hypothetical protein
MKQGGFPNRLDPLWRLARPTGAYARAARRIEADAAPDDTGIPALEIRANQAGPSWRAKRVSGRRPFSVFFEAGGPLFDEFGSLFGANLADLTEETPSAPELRHPDAPASTGSAFASVSSQGYRQSPVD